MKYEKMTVTGSQMIQVINLPRIRNLFVEVDKLNDVAVTEAAVYAMVIGYENHIYNIKVYFDTVIILTQ